MTDGRAHAELGASSSHRWMVCPGSVQLSRGVTETRSVYAAEGTAAHELGERCLRDGTSPHDAIGREIEVEGFIFEVDAEMSEAVELYVDLCNRLLAEGRGSGGVWIEHRVSLASLAADDTDVVNGMFGTADLTLHDGESHLDVIDYKHGVGIVVEALGNSQMRYYALGSLLSLLKRRQTVRTITTWVVQPRAPHSAGPIRCETLHVADLLDWADDLLRAARRTADPDAPLAPGEHCRFCAAAGLCPALREKNMQDAQLIFAEEDGAITPYTSADQLSTEELRQVLDASGRIQDWLKQAQKLAYDRLAAGRDMPGWKLVPKRAQREWRSEADAEEFLRSRGVEPDEVWQQTLVSPAQAERLVDKTDKKALQELVVAESSGNTLAPLDDSRERQPGRKRREPEDVFDAVDSQ